MRRPVRAILVTVWTGLLAAEARAQAGWDLVETVHGPSAHTLYRRQLADARVATFRREGQVDAPIGRVVAAYRRPPHAEKDGPRRELLRREGEVNFTYIFMPVPLLADRD